MKICFIAYADSIHTRRWVEYFSNNPENEVHLLTLVPASQPINGVMIHDLAGRMFNQLPKKETVPVKLLPAARSALTSVYRNPLLNSAMRVFQGERIWWEQLLLRVLMSRGQASSLIEKIRPDLVHGLSIPYGGGLAGLTNYRPLVMSTWGTDFVYFAEKYPVCRWLTQTALSKTELFFPDNTRDKYLAELYGFCPSNPSHVIPATGGLKLEEFPLYRKDYSTRARLGISADQNVLICIRGYKSFHVNTQALIRAIPQIVARFPNSLFVVDGAHLSPTYLPIRKLAEQLKVEKYIRFTDRLSRQDLSDYLNAADLMVSATHYDGWPISMLEGMAYGVVPVMTNHSPIQEWITDGWNGYLFNTTDPNYIAQAIVKALGDRDSFDGIRKRNWDILKKRADYGENMKTADNLYRQLISKRN